MLLPLTTTVTVTRHDRDIISFTLEELPSLVGVPNPKPEQMVMTNLISEYLPRLMAPTGEWDDFPADSPPKNPPR